MNDLKEFEIRNGVLKKYVGKGEDVVIPDGVTRIGDWAFEYNGSIMSATIPESVNSIGVCAFNDCENLTRITILGNIKSAEEYAFHGCKLQQIFAKNMPLSFWKKQKLMFPAMIGFLLNRKDFTDNSIIDEYEKYAFSQKKKILPFVFEKDIVEWVSFYANTGKITAANIESDFLLPAQAAAATQCVAFLLDWKANNISHKDVEKHLKKELDKDAFNRADMKKMWSFEKNESGQLIITGYKGSETDITVPPRIGSDIVTGIADEAFSPNKSKRLNMYRENMKRIRSIEIPDSVTSIGEAAFYGCDNLTSITLTSSVKNIGNMAFYKCKNLTDINTINCEIDSAVQIGERRIGDRAFYECEKLKNFSIPNCVTSIGREAFYSCERLNSISVPEGVKSIEDKTFSGCKELQSVTLPGSITNIGISAFIGCKSLTTVTIPERTTYIGGSAFSGCECLTSVIVPNGVTKIGYSAFSNCKNLKQIKIPDSLTKIENGTFWGCANLMQITVSNNVTDIEDRAFLGCMTMNNIVIPSSVVCIGASAFSGCENLIVHAPAGSYAEKYAKENNIPFVAE